MANSGLRNKIFRNIFIILAILIIIFTVLVSILTYRAGLDNTFAIIRQRNLAMKNYILWYFIPLRNTVGVLSENPKLKKGINITLLEREEILELYRVIKMIIPNINYVYSGYKENKSLLINDYIPPSGFDPTVRPWYTKALESHPYLSDGIPYQEIKDKSWLVSISKTITDRNGKIIGVISVDASLQNIVDKITVGDSSLKTSYSYITNRNNVIIVHRDGRFLNRMLKDVINPVPDFKQEEGEFSYVTIDGEDKIAYYNKIDELGWTLITVVNKNEVVLPLIFKIVLIFIGIISVAIILGILINNFLVKDLSSSIVSKDHSLDYSLNKEKQTQYINTEMKIITNKIQDVLNEELYSKNQQLIDMNDKLELASITDNLTGLYDRKKIMKEIERERLILEKRDNYDVSILMLDIDDFKDINDKYGFLEGDLVLKKLANFVRSLIRPTDIFGRWEGGKFVLILPETDLTYASIIAENLRIFLGKHLIVNDKNLTISIGAVQLKSDKSFDNIIKDVESMLYKAKKAGKNRVEYLKDDGNNSKF
ncbi:MAG TPA: diguanylate cyclase [Spirochaetota bacterium]|nr:diguanylate cyclase [Spirochaetota bacterium]HOM38458.1 diguanylate cyclase [Spirochaetota bacterium]HPQ48998.1 diguanylate cyclase [Spirochaetota bacterium]